MKYATLDQKHPEYRPDIWGELEVLYRGGYALTEDWRVKLLGTKKINERGDRYRARICLAAYIGYFGRIVNYFASALVNRPLLVKPQVATFDDQDYLAFAKDVDYAGTDLTDLVKEIVTWALVKRRVIVAVDLPRNEELAEQAKSRADERDLGLLRPRAWLIQPEQLIDWKIGEDGTYDWCILKHIICTRDSPTDDRSTIYEEFKVWERRANGAHFQIYRTKERKKNGAKPGKNHDVPLLTEGTTNFSRIPLIPFDVGDAMWVGNTVGPMNREHFQRRSGLLGAEERTVYAIPWVKYGPQVLGAGEAVLHDVSQQMDRGSEPVERAKQYDGLQLSDGDEVGFASPDTSGYELIHKELNDLVDEIYRVSHQMAQSISSTGTALRRSGTSKQEDRNATDIVLGALGEMGRELTERIYTFLADGRGESVAWSVAGMDEFETIDRSGAIEEATSIGQIDIPSPTFKLEHQAAVAKAVLRTASDETHQKIRDELAQAHAEDDSSETDDDAAPDSGPNPQVTPLDGTEEDSMGMAAP